MIEPEYADVDPAVGRQTESIEQAAVRNEIGRGDPNALLSLQDGAEIDFADAFYAGIGPD